MTVGRKLFSSFCECFLLSQWRHVISFSLVFTPSFSTQLIHTIGATRLWTPSKVNLHLYSATTPYLLKECVGYILKASKLHSCFNFCAYISDLWLFLCKYSSFQVIYFISELSKRSFILFFKNSSKPYSKVFVLCDFI